MFELLFPRKADNRFEGHRAALWMLGAYIALKLVMSLNSIFNPAKVAAGADGIPLDRFGAAAARDVVTLFALVGLGQLALALFSLLALVRYRGLVPLIFALLLCEAIARRAIVATLGATRSGDGTIGLYINLALLTLLAAGLALSLVRRLR